MATSTSDLYELFRAHPRVSTDTRCIEPGSIFFALHGANFDGNRFVGEALEKGAAAAIADRAEALADAEHRGAGLRPAALAALCGDFIHAAMALAGQVRQNAATDTHTQGCPNP